MCKWYHDCLAQHKINFKQNKKPTKPIFGQLPKRDSAHNPNKSIVYLVFCERKINMIASVVIGCGANSIENSVKLQITNNRWIFHIRIQENWLFFSDFCVCVCGQFDMVLLHRQHLEFAFGSIFVKKNLSFWCMCLLCFNISMNFVNVTLHMPLNTYDSMKQIAHYLGLRHTHIQYMRIGKVTINPNYALNYGCRLLMLAIVWTHTYVCASVVVNVTLEARIVVVHFGCEKFPIFMTKRTHFDSIALCQCKSKLNCLCVCIVGVQANLDNCAYECIRHCSKIIDASGYFPLFFLYILLLQYLSANFELDFRLHFVQMQNVSVFAQFCSCVCVYVWSTFCNNFLCMSLIHWKIY